MAWFRVDDSFVGHPKAAGLSNDSAATWLRAGDWSAWQLTDGAVPAGLLAQFAGDADDPAAVARDLVDRRLWEPGDGGWQFHDWADWNPTRAQVLDKRKKDAERRRRWLASRRDPGTGRADHAVSHAVSHDVSHGVTDDDPPGDVLDDDHAVTDDHTVSHAVTDDDHAVSHGVTRPDDAPMSERHGVAHTSPTRPDPKGRVGVHVDDQAAERNARAPEDDLDSLIQALMFNKTGRSVSTDEAASIRETILSGRRVDNPAAYIRSAIATKAEARRLLPSSGPPSPPRYHAPPKHDRSAAAKEGAADARRQLAARPRPEGAADDAEPGSTTRGLWGEDLARAQLAESRAARLPEAVPDPAPDDDDDQDHEPDPADADPEETEPDDYRPPF